MQKIKTAVRFSALCLAVLCAVIFAAVAAAYRETSPEYNVVNGKKLAIECDIPLVVRDIGGEYTTDAPPLTSFDVRLDLLGIIPLRKAKVNVVSENTVCVLGIPFGMKIYTDGVLVVNISEVDTASGNVSPAKKAGLKIDDSIITIDGQKVYTNSDVAEIIEQSGGKTLEIVIKRDNCLKRIELCPELSKSSRTYKAGIWVRDSSAGVGTLTFYLPANNTLCGLGHSVNDNDTGKILKISSGEIVKAEIISVTKAEKGKAGELRGRLLGEKYAAMNKNCECGVYGEAEKEMSLGENMSIAPKQEVRDGQALIYT
ncbi:MAG: PDZ domain-containing protein, partial [Clostridiales bacterium]|nr:PDZ domain-containing protein [Candidatus Equinaster intestinalis]